VTILNNPVAEFHMCRVTCMLKGLKDLLVKCIITIIVKEFSILSFVGI
jgi:hypothetical protein